MNHIYWTKDEQQAMKLIGVMYQQNEKNQRKKRFLIRFSFSRRKLEYLFSY